MSNKLGQEPAFKLGQEPAFASIATKPTGVTVGYNGMSKRFYAACAAMQGLLSNSELTERLDQGDLYHDLVSDSYALADELLKQENE